MTAMEENFETVVTTYQSSLSKVFSLCGLFGAWNNT